MRRTERAAGFSLLEVVVALAILAISGMAWTTLTSQTLFAVAAAHAREDRVEAASALLGRIESRPTAELMAMVGRRRIGRFTVAISLASNDVLAIEVFDSSGSERVLATRIYRRSGKRDVTR